MHNTQYRRARGVADSNEQEHEKCPNYRTRICRPARRHLETPDTEFLDPEAFLAQDLEDLRKLLAYCLPRATEDDRMFGSRMDLMNAAVRMMRLDATLVGMLLRANRGYLRDRRRDYELAAKKRPAGQSGTTGSSYHEWVKRHRETENRDRAVETPSALREKNWNSTRTLSAP